MATTEMPDSRQPRSRSGLTVLFPPRNPPPWIDTSTGAGPSDSASHTSMTFRACGPYFTFSWAGRRSWPAAGGPARARRRVTAMARPMTDLLVSVLIVRPGAVGLKRFPTRHPAGAGSFRRPQAPALEPLQAEPG